LPFHLHEYTTYPIPRIHERAGSLDRHRSNPGPPPPVAVGTKRWFPQSPTVQPRASPLRWQLGRTVMPNRGGWLAQNDLSDAGHALHGAPNIRLPTSRTRGDEERRHAAFRSPDRSPLAALMRALGRGEPEIHHSDQGVQYAATAYLSLIVPSTDGTALHLMGARCTKATPPPEFSATWMNWQGIHPPSRSLRGEPVRPSRGLSGSSLKGAAAGSVSLRKTASSQGDCSAPWWNGCSRRCAKPAP
jgi:hypothetical protein